MELLISFDNMIRPNILSVDGSIDFPYETFPWRLEHKGKQTVCHFQCEEHIQKYIDRYKLKSKDIIVKNRNGKSLVSSKKHTRSVESSTRKKSNRGTGTVRKRKSSVDSTRNSTSNRKTKKT